MSTKLQPEQKTRKEVLAYLRKRGHHVFPIDTRARTNARGMYVTFNADYGTKGCADLLTFHKSSPISPVWMELKRAGKTRIDADQILFRDRVRLLGHEYAVVNSEKDLVDLGF